MDFSGETPHTFLLTSESKDCTNVQFGVPMSIHLGFPTEVQVRGYLENSRDKSKATVFLESPLDVTLELSKQPAGSSLSTTSFPSFFIHSFFSFHSLSAQSPPPAAFTVGKGTQISNNLPRFCSGIMTFYLPPVYHLSFQPQLKSLLSPSIRRESCNLEENAVQWRFSRFQCGS